MQITGAELFVKALRQEGVDTLWQVGLFVEDRDDDRNPGTRAKFLCSLCHHCLHQTSKLRKSYRQGCVDRAFTVRCALSFRIRFPCLVSAADRACGVLASCSSWSF